MSIIQVMQSQLANQIAAGEVVERPAAVVKELIENSIDAGATQISVDILQGGRELIRVRDNGAGIYKDDLALTVCRHATSKIIELSDLESVNTLGFRGEALASMASVSRMTVVSMQQDEEHAFEIITADDGTPSEPKPASHPQGTTITVKDIFYNTPARRKFLRTIKTEFSHIETILQRLAMSHFDIGFHFKHNQKEIFNLKACDTQAAQEQRLASILGRDFIQDALALEFSAAGLTLSGWVALPTFSRSQPDMQYCYINGRYVRDKVLTHAIRSAYHDILFNGRHPAYVLYLTIDPTQVDVNVHPTKHEVRFRESRLVHNFVSRGVQEALASVQVGCHSSDVCHSADDSQDSFSGEANAGAIVAEAAQSAVATISQPEVVSTPVVNEESLLIGHAARPYEAVSSRPADRAEVKAQMDVYQRLHTPVQEVLPVAELVQESHQAELPLGVAIGQVKDTFILAQNDDGLIVVDMHAAHERILYQRLKQDYKKNTLAIQQQLLPITLEISQAELRAFEDNIEIFSSVGMMLDQVGPLTLAIREAPSMIKQGKLPQLVRDVLADLVQLNQSVRIEQYIDQLLGTMGCHAAVRAPHRLSLDEMNQILRDMEATTHAGFCNHGRPTWVSYSMKAMNNWFLRGQ